MRSYPKIKVSIDVLLYLVKNTGLIACYSSGKILRKDFKTVVGHPVQIYQAKKRAVRQSKL